MTKTVDLNPSKSKSVTVTAQWKSNDPTIPTGACSGNYTQVNVNLVDGNSQTFDYTNTVRCAYLQKEGYYKLEVWGAQGNIDTYNSAASAAGYGGYSYGSIYANAGSSLYVVTGGQPTSGNGGKAGGYNGGGYGYEYFAPGGGATHISTVNCGELKNCSAYKGTYNSSLGTYDGGSILIVAGGGGGSGHCGNSTGAHGGNGGGQSGGTGYTACNGTNAQGGSQISGGAGSTYSGNTGSGGSFGVGGNGNTTYGSGGGGGWFGGGGGGASAGGGGSGYIGNSLLLSDKGMYQYYYKPTTTTTDCSSSTTMAVKTTCTTLTGHASTNAANTGNGYAKITYLGTTK